jgi:hypothetical protein
VTRRELLDRLEMLNAALDRHRADPLVTLAEGKAMRVSALRQAVYATGDQVAKLAEAEAW